MTPGQQLALKQLGELATGDSGLDLLDHHSPGDSRLHITISVPTDSSTSPGSGIRLRAREKFEVIVDATFPFAPPTVQVSHRRWAGTPHVQWGHQLCLYAAPSTEWVPSDGMNGLLERLLTWLERAEAGSLQAEGVPLHPPVAYTYHSVGSLVVRADLGDLVPWCEPVTPGPRLLTALCTTQRGNSARLDVVDWMPADEYRAQVALGKPPTGVNGRFLIAAVVILLHHDIGFEYPDNGADLLQGLHNAGLAPDDLIEALAVSAYGNALAAYRRGSPAPGNDDTPSEGPGGAPQLVLVGTPSRTMGSGARLAHLVAWRIPPQTGELATHLGARTVDHFDTDPAKNRAAMSHYRDLSKQWLSSDPVLWARVFDDRREITQRRDHASSATWLTGKRVLLLGCGALGAPMAQAIVRAGAAALDMVDNGWVTPGILVRQPFNDADIGQPKVLALSPRLRQICPDNDRRCTIAGRTENAVTAAARLTTEGDSYDLVIDATADAAVRAALERARATSNQQPTQVTVLLGHQARRGIVTVARPGASGGGEDILRRVGLLAASGDDPQLDDVAADFYPTTPSDQFFFPEPGCSAPTFIGSATECTALATSLLAGALDILDGRVIDAGAQPMTATVIRLDSAESAKAAARTTLIGWDNDYVHWTHDRRHQVRLRPTACATLRAQAQHTAQRFGSRVETGGMLLGEIDDATGVVYLDAATPPSPDSMCGTHHFEHGTEGTQALIDHHTGRTRGVTSFIGMWHTHPLGPARPSRTDEAGMANLVTPVVSNSPRGLMLIAGGTDGWDTWRDGAEDNPPPQLYLRVVERNSSEPAPASQPERPDGQYYRAGQAPAPAPAPGRSWWRRILSRSS
ncbi:hypothetical protein ASG36_20750 [Geodermatophilus sp. Leaf369]|uniref:ThiF family adenylyltransferase n=1 Tax=Geodermatophilus sp. Leaf369 TaxID=1736354 RepID=UPI0006FEBB84|nr:ThiF family adenylyltransferase [Geodermatophilus sp. Leaf369]KQS54531.1 hypothetical protein ASG36_20750 [Geodermatophilus sp. Leaf369]